MTEKSVAEVEKIEETIEQRVSKTNNTFKIIGICILATICFLSTYGTISYKQSFDKSQRELMLTEARLINALGRVNDINVKLVAAEDTNEALSRQLVGVSNQSDLLKRDMNLYIRTTHPKVPRVVALEIAKNIVEISHKYNISPELILGICKVESSFNPMAVGPKTKYGHARGLMQVMPEWWKKLKIGLKSQYGFHDIDKGIEAGIKVFLIHLKEGKGDISTGLYYYVNKDKAYVAKVYAAVGKFVAFRATLFNDDQNVDSDILKGDTNKAQFKKSKKKETKKDDA